MTQTLALTFGSMPLSAMVLRAGSRAGRLLLVLYLAVAGGVLAQLAPASPDWVPEISTG